MKKSLIVLTGVLVCVMFTAVSAFSANNAKIGIIDFQKILTTSSQGKLVTEEMNKKGKEMEEDVEKKGAGADRIAKKT